MTNTQLQAKREPTNRYPPAPRGTFHEEAERAFARQKNGEPHPGARPRTTPELRTFILSNVSTFVPSKEGGKKADEYVRQAEEMLGRERLSAEQRTRAVVSVSELIGDIKEQFPNAQINVENLVRHKVLNIQLEGMIADGVVTNPWTAHLPRQV